MKFYPNPVVRRHLWLTFFTLVIIISCSKDNDLFSDSVLSNKSVPTVGIEVDSSETEVEEIEEVVEEVVVNDSISSTVEESFETRTTVFAPIHDAHLQGDAGFNQDIVRLEENRRTSFLMFDLSQIDSIGGNPKAAQLEFTIDSDGGSGTITVHKADSNQWSEENLSTKTAPETDVQIGSISTEFKIGETHEVALDTALIKNEVFSLVLTHESGNDLAFASKEHSEVRGPALVVTYEAPQDAEAIVFENQEESLQAVVSGESVGDDEETGTSSSEESSDNPDTPDNKDSEGDGTDEEATTDEADNSDSTDDESQDDSNEESTENQTVGETDTEDANQGEVSDNESQEEEEEEETEESPDNDGENQSEGEAADEDSAEEDEEESNSEADAPENVGPEAVAEANPTSGTVPLEVTFKGSNSSDDTGIKDYLWDFRDGSTSYDANPTHTFEKSGTLEVRLTVTDDQGETDTATITITAQPKEPENKAPKAVASASETSGEAPFEVQFNANDSTDDVEIEGYRWDFKDGNTTGNKNPSHIFEEPGTYQVELTVTDDQGLENSTSITIEVTESENEAPKAVITGGPFEGDAPLGVDFKAHNSSDDKGITAYFWNFGDGNETTTKNPDHSFTEPGTYSVELTVKDEEGLSHTTNTQVTVSEPSNNGGGSSGGDDSGNDSDGGSGGGDNDDGSSGGDNGSGSSGGSSGNYPSNAVFASDFGFNSSDATSAFEAAINSGNSYVVIDKQSSDWIIRPTRFYDLRNMTIVFESGVVLRAKSGAFGDRSSELVHLTRARNVTIDGKGATFQMNKSEYSSGEQRHALSIDRCSDLTVRGITFRDSGGDGIIISGDSKGDYSENITLENVRCLNNRRDGITIVSAQNVYIRNSEFSQSSGTKPEAGATIEADNPNERLVNINFTNCKFSGNDSSGLHVSGVRMNRSSRPISVTLKDCEFSNNTRSPASGVVRTEVYLSQGPHNDPVGGSIVFERVRFNGSTHQIIFSRNAHDAFNTTFKDCTANDVSRNGSRGVIELQALNTETTLGGFRFENFRMQYSRDVPFMEINAPSSNMVVRDVQGDFRVDEPNDNPLKYSGGYNPSKNQNVSINYSHN